MKQVSAEGAEDSLNRTFQLRMPSWAKLNLDSRFQTEQIDSIGVQIHAVKVGETVERTGAQLEVEGARSLSDFPTFRPETPSETIGSESPRPRR